MNIPPKNVHARVAILCQEGTTANKARLLFC